MIMPGLVGPGAPAPSTWMVKVGSLGRALAVTCPVMASSPAVDTVTKCSLVQVVALLIVIAVLLGGAVTVAGRP